MKDGFNAVFDKNSRLLILGSFPSVLSFQNGFYYGNPRNNFGDLYKKFLPKVFQALRRKNSFC